MTQVAEEGLEPSLSAYGAVLEPLQAFRYVISINYWMIVCQGVFSALPIELRPAVAERQDSNLQPL